MGRRNPHRYVWPYATLGFAASFLVLAAGCGGDDEPSGSNGQRPDRETSSRTSTSHGEEKSPARASRREPAPQTPVDPGPRTITGPGGVPTIIRPELPSARVAHPSAGCIHRRRSGGLSPLVLPPQPGLRARRLQGGSILVSYELPAATTRCRVFRLRLTLYSSGADGGSQTRLRPISGRTGEYRLNASSFAQPPDVARASTVMRNGIRSPVASVLIQ